MGSTEVIMSDVAVTFGDMVIIEGDLSSTQSGILVADNGPRLDAAPASADYPESAEWMIMHADGEEDQMCQSVNFGENVRLINPGLDQRLHFDGRMLSIWAKPDGSGDTDDNWTLLTGTGGDGADAEWTPNAPFVLRHCKTGHYVAGFGNQVCADPELNAARRFSLARVL